MLEHGQLPVAGSEDLTQRQMHEETIFSDSGAAESTLENTGYSSEKICWKRIKI